MTVIGPRPPAGSPNIYEILDGDYTVSIPELPDGVFTPSSQMIVQDGDLYLKVNCQSFNSIYLFIYQTDRCQTQQGTMVPKYCFSNQGYSLNTSILNRGNTHT